MIREDINRTWENIKENIKASAKVSLGLDELKQHKPWFCDASGNNIFPAQKVSMVTVLCIKGFYWLFL
jgi:hypothetical protein